MLDYSIESHLDLQRGSCRGSIEVICGSMFSGKTEELMRRIRRALIARLRVEVFKPDVDTRYSQATTKMPTLVQQWTTPLTSCYWQRMPM